MNHIGSASPRIAIRFTAKQLMEAIDHMADGTLIVNGDGRIVHASGQVAALFGYTPEQLIGQPMELLVPEDQRSPHRRARSKYGRAPTVRPMGGSLDIVGCRRDGSQVPLDVWLAPLGAGLVLANVRDMTDTRQQEAGRAAELARLRNAEARDRTAQATHDIVLQLLFGVAAGLQALRGRSDEVTEGALAHAIELIDDTIQSVRHEAFGGGS
ncbi:MAG: PAS domain S-box protein [Acidimicrobiales bacterium]